VSQVKNCTKCGAALTGSPRFCTNCGAKQEETFQPQIYGVPPPPPPQTYNQSLSQPYVQPHQQPISGKGMFDRTEFIVNQKLLAIRNTYVIKDRQGQQLGFVKQEFLSWGPHFWFEDNAGNRLGDINGKVLTIHNEYEIKDNRGQLHGKVKKKIMKLIGTEWWMEDPNGNEIARIKGNFIHHTYQIVAPDNSVIAKVHLAWVTIRDEYGIEIMKPGFDPLLVLGYAIALDNVEHENKNNRSTFKIGF
jgi:uncharacterized protein YxjI